MKINKQKIDEIMNVKIDNNRIIVYLLLIVFALFLAMLNSISVLNKDSYISIDVAVWTNIAKLMKEGRIIYRDIFDHKGPILLILYFFSYSIGKINGIWFMDFLCSIVNVIVIYLIARKFNLSRIKSIIIVAISVIFLSLLCLENPCTESIALPFILISFYYFIRFIKNSNSFRRKESFITGICLGIVLLIRPNLASLWVIYDIFIFLKLLKKKEVKILLSIIEFSFLGVFFICIPIFLYLYINNAMGDFIKIYCIFNFKYAGAKEQTLIKTILDFIKLSKGILLITFVNYIGIFIYIIKNKIKDKELIITGFIYYLFTFYLVIMPQRSYIHYLIPMLPSFLIPMILTLKYIKIRKILSKIFVIICIIIMIIIMNANIIEKKKKWGYSIYLDSISKFIKENSKIEDNILQLGNRANIYLLSERQYNGKYFYQIPIAFQNKEIGNAILNEIERDYPKIIIDTWKNWKVNKEDNESTRSFKTKIKRVLDEKYIKKNLTEYILKE